MGEYSVRFYSLDLLFPETLLPTNAIALSSGVHLLHPGVLRSCENGVRVSLAVA